MRSVFSKSAKRIFILAQLVLLTAVLFSIFVPLSGLTFDGPQQVELAVKNPDQIGSALWVTNLGVHNTKLIVGINPNSIAAQERLYTSELIAAGKTVRLDNSLPSTFRSNDTLFIRGHEEIATLTAPVGFPVQSSEFYSSPLRQQDGRPQALPKWVRELGAIGKSGNNVFNSDRIGYAPAVKGQTEPGKHYEFGVGVALTKGNSSAEFKLISRAGQTIESLTLSSSKPVNWQARLGEFNGGADDYPSRIEMRVLTGTAQGFLSIKDVDSGEVTPLPIAPFAGESSVEGDEEEILADSRTGGPMLSEESSFAPHSVSGGYAYFSNGVYDKRYDSYTYNVYSAPPNVCGTLNIIRNGNSETTGNWICTNAYGQATKGPWTVANLQNQTGECIYIQWPDSSTTVGGDYKVDDGSDPTIEINQSGGFGVPIPSQFDGSGSDTQWGTGFNFGFGGWSTITATFQNVTTNKYYNGHNYISDDPVPISGTASPSTGFNITWSVTPPPTSAHNSTDDYYWCVFSKDYFYPCSTCVEFYGPR